MLLFPGTFHGLVVRRRRVDLDVLANGKILEHAALLVELGGVDAAHVVGVSSRDLNVGRGVRDDGGGVNLLVHVGLGRSAPSSAHSGSGQGTRLRAGHDLERGTREAVAFGDVPGPCHSLEVDVRLVVVLVVQVADAHAEESPEGFDGRIARRAVASCRRVHVAVFAGKGRECLADEFAGVVGVDLVGRSVPEQDLVSDCVCDSVCGAVVEAGELDPK